MGTNSLYNQNILSIDNIEELGNLYINYRELKDKSKSSILSPVIKVFKNNPSDYVLTCGYLTIEDEFIECPLSIHYVELDKIKIFKVEKLENVYSKIKIFSKDFVKYREIEINLKSGSTGSGVVNAMDLNGFINTINEFVYFGEDIDLLNHELFNKCLPNKLDTDAILKHINNLKFKFFSNDVNRIGRDNYFWNEVEIDNLPKSEYLIHLFLNIIKYSKYVNNVNYKDSILLATYNGSYGYAASTGRDEIEFDSIMAEKIKDILKFKLHKEINLIQELNERLKI